MGVSLVADTDTQTNPNADASGNGGTDTQAAGERRFTQAELDAHIDARLKRERAATEAKSAADKQAAETERLKQQAEWEKVANQHEQTVRELTPQLETAHARYAALAERNNKLIDQTIKDWPIEIRRLVPASDDVAARLDAFDNAKSIFEKFGNVQTPNTQPYRPGSAPSPRPGAPNKSAVDQEMERLQASGKYTRG